MAGAYTGREKSKRNQEERIRDLKLSFTDAYETETLWIVAETLCNACFELDKETGERRRPQVGGRHGSHGNLSVRNARGGKRIEAFCDFPEGLGRMEDVRAATGKPYTGHWIATDGKNQRRKKGLRGIFWKSRAYDLEISTVKRKERIL